MDPGLFIEIMGSYRRYVAVNPDEWVISQLTKLQWQGGLWRH